MILRSKEKGFHYNMSVILKYKEGERLVKEIIEMWQIMLVLLVEEHWKKL